RTQKAQSRGRSTWKPRLEPLEERALPSLTSIAVTPANPILNAGQTQQFTAIGTFSDGSSQVLPGNFSTWASQQSMLTPRWVAAVGTVNGSLYAVGGDTNGGFVGTNEAYNPMTNTWTAK